jgi:hypothetical protein
VYHTFRTSMLLEFRLFLVKMHLFATIPRIKRLTFLICSKTVQVNRF